VPQVLGGSHAGLLHESMQIPVPVVQQLVRMPQLHHPAHVHHHHPVVIHHGVQSMGDGQHGAVRELGTDRLLDEIVRPAEGEGVTIS